MSSSTSLNQSQPARNFGEQLTQYLAFTANFNTLGIGTADTVLVGTLPSGAQILTCVVRVVTAFNAVTTNVLTVGTSSGSDADIVGAADVAEGVVGTTVVGNGIALAFSSDTPIYVKYTQTGTAATTGQAVIVISYAVITN